MYSKQRQIFAEEEEERERKVRGIEKEFCLAILAISISWMTEKWNVVYIGGGGRPAIFKNRAPTIPKGSIICNKMSWRPPEICVYVVKSKSNIIITSPNPSPEERRGCYLVCLFNTEFE